MRFAWAIVPVVLVAGAFAGGCRSSSSACTGANCTPSTDDFDGSTVNGEFVAIGSDFQGFMQWDSTFLGDNDVVGPHLKGPRTVYINKKPPPGSLEYPVGTIIVKTVQVGARPDWQIFAMAKRGAEFNPLGAYQWEWFGLQLFDNDVVKIEWRGFGPPDEDAGGYGGGVLNPCNKCHTGARDNDYVWSLSVATGKVYDAGN